MKSPAKGLRFDDPLPAPHYSHRQGLQPSFLSQICCVPSQQTSVPFIPDHLSSKTKQFIDYS